MLQCPAEPLRIMLTTRQLSRRRCLPNRPERTTRLELKDTAQWRNTERAVKQELSGNRNDGLIPPTCQTVLSPPLPCHKAWKRSNAANPSPRSKSKVALDRKISPGREACFQHPSPNTVASVMPLASSFLDLTKWKPSPARGFNSLG